MISREILKAKLKNLYVYIPVNKPAGMCCQRLREGLRLDLYFVAQHHGLNQGNYTVEHARALEPFADGLVTFIMGHKVHNKKNFVKGDYIYRADIEFGVKRRLDCIDGEVLDRLPTNHVTASEIRSKLSKYIGHMNQGRYPTYQISSDRKEELPKSQLRSLTHIDYYNRMILAEKQKVIKRPQKYSYAAPPKEFFVRDIVLDSYIEPIASFTFYSQGSLSIRKFASDFAAELGTYANVTKLTRIQEGPIHLDDIRVLQTYELNFEYYIDRLRCLRELYEDFHNLINPLWYDSD